MYLTAQRVVAPAGDHEGINVFRYSHGDQVWTGTAPAQLHPDADPGVLVSQIVTVAPPGNRVRSFLDLVAPEDAGLQEVRAAVEALAEGDAPPTFPTEWTRGRLYIRFGSDRALAPFWRSELRALAAATAPLLP